MALIEWFVKNKEWLFSGLGITVMTFLIRKLFGIKRKTLNLSYSYTRAFGVTQVPMFLRAMASEYPLNTLGMLHAEDKEKFWAGWPHKSCTTIQTSAYKELFDENLFAVHSHKLLEEISLENPVSADFYKTEIDYDFVDAKIQGIEWWALTPFRKYEIYRQVVPGNYSIEEVSKAIAKASKEVGFLLLFLKNDSNQPLNNLRLLYKDSQHPDPLNIALNKGSMGKAQNKEIIIRHIGQQEELILLLQIYRKDINGYPSSYYSSINIPLEIRYSTGFLCQRIKKPNRDKAAKIPFPFGWTGQ